MGTVHSRQIWNAPAPSGLLPAPEGLCNLLARPFMAGKSS
jgi:hypothetical protein